MPTHGGDVTADMMFICHLLLRFADSYAFITIAASASALRHLIRFTGR